MINLPRYISNLEKTDGEFSIMFCGKLSFNLEKFFKNKKVSIVYSESKYNSNRVEWFDIIYKTSQTFYIHIRKENDDWNMNIYYKPNQFDELFLFLNQLYKQLNNGTINN